MLDMSHPATPTRRHVTDTIATANMLVALKDDTVRGDLNEILDHKPDALALVEFPPYRNDLLPGKVVRFARLDRLFAGHQPTHGYVWARPLLGPTGVLGLDVQRYELLSCRSVRLSKGAKVRPTDRHPRARYWTNRACEVHAWDRLRREHVVFLVIHLIAGVQAADGSYNDDATRVGIHQEQRRELTSRVARHTSKGRTVYVLGDTNFSGLHLAFVTSAWEGRRRLGTHDGSKRAIDDVFGPGRADTVELVETHSDHDAVIARRRRALPPPSDHGRDLAAHRAEVAP